MVITPGTAMTVPNWRPYLPAFVLHAQLGGDDLERARIGSSSGADSPPGTKSAPRTIARWSSSPPSSSGSNRDSSDRP